MAIFARPFRETSFVDGAFYATRGLASHISDSLSLRATTIGAPKCDGPNLF